MKKLNKYLIKAYCSVYEEFYKEGEGNNVNNYNIEKTIIAENAKKVLSIFFDEKLFYKFDYKCLDLEDLKSTDFYYTVLINKNNEEATKAEIKLWKNNKFNLYSCNICINIYKLKLLTNLDLK